MIVNNFKQLVKAHANKHIYDGSTYYNTSGAITCTPISGDKTKNYYIGANSITLGLISVGPYYYYSFYNQNNIITSQTATYSSSNGSAVCIMFGDGNKEVSPEDFCLDGTILNLTFIASETKETVGEASIQKSYIMTIRNDTGEEINIREYGLVCNCGSTTVNTSQKGAYYIMFDRTVLDVPITLQPGETSSVTITWETPYPQII